MESEQLEQLAAEIASKSPDDEVMSMVTALTESIAMVHNIPCDFDGLSLNVLRDPDTHQLIAVVIVPVDVPKIPDSAGADGVLWHDGDPVPRYKIEASHIRMAEAPKIELPN